MPLSEHEERILHEIERRFYANDPQRARRLQETTLPRFWARRCRRAAVGFVVGLVVLLVALATTWEVGVLGLALMLVSAVSFTQNARRMGRHGWQAIRAAGPPRQGEALSQTLDRIRRRWGGGGGA
ncbi:MAG TPA: DUF3040 domain-containing protein [Acidimicrobiales bacterium]|nr:DUF3040 domain-containing protein [Acidimicrobiales bacterium]